jgi:hypothetical protein
LKYLYASPTLSDYIKRRGKTGRTGDDNAWSHAIAEYKSNGIANKFVEYSKMAENIAYLIDGIIAIKNISLLKGSKNPFENLSFAEQNLKAEQLTGDALKAMYPAEKGFTVVPQAKLKYDEISGSFKPDWVVLNNKNVVVAVVDSKGASGSLTTQQRPFFKADASATISVGQYQGVNVVPANVTKQTFNWDRITGGMTISNY